MPWRTLSGAIDSQTEAEERTGANPLFLAFSPGLLFPVCPTGAFAMLTDVHHTTVKGVHHGTENAFFFWSRAWRLPYPNFLERYVWFLKRRFILGDGAEILTSPTYFSKCRVLDDFIDRKRYPLFLARAVLQELLESLQSTGSVKQL